MKMIDFLNSPAATALGWTMLHALWQGFALVLPMAVTLHLLRSRSSALRYRLSVLTLLAQLLASVVTFAWYYQPNVATASPRPVASLMINTLTTHWQPTPYEQTWPQQMQQFLGSHLSQIVLIYLLGVTLFGLRLAGGWLYLQRLSQTATLPVSTIWTDLTDRLRSALAIRAVVQVRESARIAVPMVVGMLKPMLLLPAGLATGLSMREIEAVLAHELAHIKRHDYAVNLLQSTMEVLYFFHPALWWLSARIREEREHCCDDLAVAVCGGDGRILAQALAQVEELRLRKDAQTPALAMAFASKRQQLLHRVRRVLGVPTRPYVSNGSLAGLTLATLLLLSVSVYAVQQDKKQPKPAKPKATQRFSGTTSGQRITFGMADNRLDYVVMNGKRLPKARVQRIQQQLDQVRAGQLNLDTVAQPDRDILLTIIEKNVAFDAGMKALSEGLSHITYDNMNVARASVEIVDSVFINDEWVRIANAQLTPQYAKVVDATLANLPQTQEVALAAMAKVQMNYDSLDRQRAYHQRQMDSLSQLVAQRVKQAEALRLEMEKLQFPIEALKREQDVLIWRKDKLLQQRDALIEKHHQLLNNNRQKLNQADIEKQLGALQPEIKKLEGGVEELNRQFEALNSREEEVKLPMDKLKRQADDLSEQINQLSEQMSRHSEPLLGMAHHNMNLNLHLNESLNLNLNRELNEHRRQAERDVRIMRGNLQRLQREARMIPPVPPAAALAPLHGIAAPPPPPKAPRAVTPARPGTPVKAARPTTTPKPAVAPVPKPE